MPAIKYQCHDKESLENENRLHSRSIVCIKYTSDSVQHNGSVMNQSLL